MAGSRIIVVRGEEGSISEKSNREVIERYIEAITELDFDTQEQLRHAGYVSEWPQSGERVRGPANARAITANWPGGLQGGRMDTKTLHGSEDRWVATSVGTVLRISGTGDVYTGLFTATYPGDSRVWHNVCSHRAPRWQGAQGNGDFRRSV